MYNCHKELSRLAKKGVAVSVLSTLGESETYEGFELDTTPDGHLISFPTNRPAKFTIKISVIEKNGQKVVPAIIEPGEGKKIVPLSGKPEENTLVYKRRVATKPLKLESMYTTKYVDNNVRIFRIEGNSFEMWEVAIVTRIDESKNISQYFLTVQLVYSSKMFRSGKGAIEMPGFSGYKKWKSLQRHLTGWVTAEDLYPKPVKKIETAPKKEVFKSNTGRVLFFNLANGKGFIESDQGPLSVHWSEIATEESEGFAHLEAGQPVSYLAVDTEEKTNNLKAITVAPIAV